MKRWPIKPLGEICEFVRGITFKPTDLVEAGSPDSLACFRTKNIQVTLEADDLIHIPRSFVKTDRQLVREGDTLISTANSNKLVEKCCFVPHIDYSATLGGFIVAVRSDQKQIKPRFLYYWLTSSLIQDRLRGLARQTTNISNLPVTDVAKEPAPVPPLAEQERIVKLLDEADELRKLRAQSDLRAAALIPALFHEMFGDPTENSKNHPVLLLKDVCNRITDGTHQPPLFSQEGIPFLFVRNIVKGRIDFETEKFITNETFDELTRRVRPERRDILYSTVGSYGVAVEVQTDRKFAFQRHIGHLKPNHQKVDSGFLTAQLNAPFVKRQADERARGIAQKTVNLAEIREFKVLVPPLPLQKEFAARVAEIRGMESAQSASRKRLDDLFQSMLHRAFEGEL